ncbi:MAG: site-2 protease family protein [Chloroflexota bacterium]
MDIYPSPEGPPTERLLATLAGVFDVASYRVLPVSSAKPDVTSLTPTMEVRGHLLLPADEAYEDLSRRLRPLGYVPLLRRVGNEDLLMVLAGDLPRGGSNARLALVLFALTVVSVLAVGGLSEGAQGQLTLDWWTGLAFAASLLSILVAHEMGHYLVARRLGVPASLPFFIPLPFSILGTMGAVMQIKAPPRNRRALLALGAAGPLAGLVVALPVLWLGLSLSEVRAMGATPGGFQEGNSLLYAGLKWLVFGRLLPGGGEDVFLHPVALAGWAGLLVTALNLLPAGQLDGGHIAYALLGERARVLTGLVVVGLALLGLLWWGWYIWAGLAFVFARVHAVPLDDITSLAPSQRLGALAMFLLAALVFVPVPMQPL